MADRLRDMTFDAEASCALAAGAVERQDPFVLSRFGDGDLYVMKADTAEECAAMLQATLGDRPGRPPLANSDAEEWTPDLRDSLRETWDAVTTGKHQLMFGNPRTSGFGLELYPYWDRISAAIQRDYISVHHEMFWLTNQPQPELTRFCKALRNDSRVKVLVGRAETAPAAEMMECDFLEVQPHKSFEDAGWVTDRVAFYDVVVLCAGRGAKEMLRLLLDTERTIIDAGALFDPLFIENSRPRPGQATDADAEALFSEVMGRPVSVAQDRPGRPYGCV